MGDAGVVAADVCLVPDGGYAGGHQCLFHKTLPKSSAFINRISLRFYETDCTIDNN